MRREHSDLFCGRKEKGGKGCNTFAENPALRLERSETKSNFGLVSNSFKVELRVSFEKKIFFYYFKQGMLYPTIVTKFDV